MVFLVHHAEAADPAIDPQRPLTSAGRAHADRLAADLASRGARPQVVWHSGKLRARQTAEAFWRACNPLAEFTAIRGLQPDDPPDWIRDRLLGDARDIMVVGHMPNVARIADRLAGAGTTFPPHGVMAIDWDGKAGRVSWTMG